jgi:uncharacterized membrane protein YkoI
MARGEGRRKVFLMNKWKKSGFAVAASTLALSACAWANEGSDKLRSAPAAVQSAVIQVVGTNKIDDFDMETENGKTVYDLDFKIKGTDYEVDVDPSGQILSREVEVDLSIIPPAVIEAAKKAHADGKIGEGSIVTAGSKMFYELDMKVGKDSREIQIDAGGAVLADAVEAPEAHEAAEKPEKPGDKEGEHEDKD